MFTSLNHFMCVILESEREEKKTTEAVYGMKTGINTAIMKWTVLCGLFTMLARRRILRLLLRSSQKLCECRINSAPPSSTALKVVVNDRTHYVVKPKRGGWKSSKGGDAWKIALIADLEKELKAENRRFSILQGNRAQHALLIRYV
ncbi:hypothetical protein COOONC_15899 [Cooperia oncophora]